MGIKRRYVNVMMKLARVLDFSIGRYWSDYPFGRSPVASGEVYEEKYVAARSEEYPEIDKYEKQAGFAVSMEWLDELALHTQVVVKPSAVCYAHGRVLYTALSKYLSENSSNETRERINVWETGTARGFSAVCMAKALKEQSRDGLIMTFDVLPHHEKMYWNCIDDAAGPQSRASLLRPWKELVDRYVVFHQGDTRVEFQKVSVDRIHFAFLDGAHTYEDVMFEFQQVTRYQQSGDMIVYDDYTPAQFPGLVKAVDEICGKYGYDCSVLSAHQNRGYVIARKR